MRGGVTGAGSPQTEQQTHTHQWGRRGITDKAAGLDCQGQKPRETNKYHTFS